MKGHQLPVVFRIMTASGRSYSQTVYSREVLLQHCKICSIFFLFLMHQTGVLMRLEDVTAQSSVGGGGPTNLRPLVRHGPLLPLDGRSEHSFKKRRGGTQLSGRNEYLLPLPERRPFLFFFFF